MSNNEIKSVFLQGKAMWAQVLEARPNFDGEPEYSLDLALTDKQIAALHKAGMSKKRKVKEVDGTNYVTFRRPVKAKSGKDLLPLIVIGRDKAPFGELIGNGSEVKVKLDLIPYSGKFGSGVITRLAAVQVIEHVPYAKKNSQLDGFDQLDEAVEGFEEVDSDSSFKDDDDDLI